MPQQAGHYDPRARAFLLDASQRVRQCDLLRFPSYAKLQHLTRLRPSELCKPDDLTFVGSLRAAINGSYSQFDFPLSKALRECSRIAARRYAFAHRPARSDLLLGLAHGLTSVARSGLVPHPIVAASLSPLFPDGVGEGDLLFTLDVLASSISGLPHFANPLLGQALCEAHGLLLDAFHFGCDTTAAQLFHPSLFPLAAVAAAAAFSPNTSVLSGKTVADFSPTVRTHSASAGINIETTYTPRLSTAVHVASGNQLRFRCHLDSFNSLAALLLLPAEEGPQALALFSIDLDPFKEFATISIGETHSRLSVATLAALQHCVDQHLADPTHVAWSNCRAIMMGDF